MADATTSVVEQTNIPSYARPYVEEMLGATAGQIFNYARDAQGQVQRDAEGRPVISGFRPQESYQGERFAQFTPLQLQSYQGAQNLGVAPQLGAATGLATAAGLGALGQQYQAGTFNPQQIATGTFGQPQAEQYMSPYMQSVTDIQQREAQRQADIARTQLHAQATRAGAFGGGRHGIMEAEANRNLALQLGDIQATGLQAAYQNAQQQFNADQARRLQASMANQQAGLQGQQLGEQSRQFGAGLGMQGAGLGLQAAGTLGQLGQTQFGQQTGALGLQNQFGTQQQQQVQNILGQQYQEFMEQRDNPYNRLGFMSNMLRGLPLAQTTQSTTTPPPSSLSQIVGLGTAAAGLGRFFAEGGAVKQESSGLTELLARRLEAV
jgi:hypothetical protein